MTDRPILFSGEQVRAILEGRKTMMRRIVKFKPLHTGLNFGWSGLHADHYYTGSPKHGWVLRARRGDGCWEDKTERAFCPYGVPGDRLWVRETWADCEPIRYRADLIVRNDLFRDDDQAWSPSIFMPRRASRITLEITGVRVERLQNISGKDAVLEGWHGPEMSRVTALEVRGSTISGNAAIEWYIDLWNTINAKRGYSWGSNPWVWVIEFRRVA